MNTKHIEALKLALEALEHMCMHTRAKVGYRSKLIGEAMDKAREALVSFQDGAQSHSDEEQPAPVAKPHEQQEPWGACVSGRVFVGRLPDHARKFSEDEGVPIQWLYTSPPASNPLPEDYTALEQALTRLQKRYTVLEAKASKPWVGLTGHEQKELMAMSSRDAVFATEAKLKEKNA